jgi:hypothetical protein
LTDAEIGVLESLQVTLASEVGSQIKQLITADEFHALKLRIMRLLSERVFPSPSPDWPAVPWPPF